MRLKADVIIDREVLDDPYPFYEQLRQEQPVWKVPGLDLVYVASTEHIVDALRRVDDFSNHLDVLVVREDDGSPTLFRTDSLGEGTTTLATADPPEHTAHRSVVFGELVARRMENMRPELELVVNEHIDASRQQGSRVEWTSAVAHPIPARVIGRLIGLPDEDWPQVMQWALHGGQLLAGIHDRATMKAYAQEAGEAGQYLANKLVEAMPSPGDDLVGVCARAVSEGKLEVGDAVGTLVILLGAGGESTAALIGNAVRLLAEDAGLQEQLRDDHRLIEPFIEEALRLESPFRGHFRQVRRSCRLGGVDINKGTTALLLWASANRDQAEYDRADEVVLDRRIPRSHLAFGRGIHHCVGAALARLEGVEAIKGLLSQSSWFTLVEDDPPQWEASLFVRRNSRLPLDVSWN